jgi:hypothetical protein
VIVSQPLDLLSLACSLDAVGDTVRALAVLDLAAAGNAAAADALALKGNLLRARGDIRQAADVFDLLDRRHPDHPYARYLSDLLGGASPALPCSRPAPWPSAFVRIEDFLDRARHDELLALVTSRSSAFEPSTVGTVAANGREPQVVLGDRVSFRLTDITPVARWIRPLITACLPTIGARLGIGSFAVAEIELKCTAYGDGNFFKVHSDGRFHHSRRVSFVYYFHRLPKRYSGGALLLYDGDVANPTRYFPDRLTRLETLDNSIVLFPSGSHHEVTRVVSPSGRLEDARFTFAGHVHAADPKALAPGAPAA